MGLFDFLKKKNDQPSNSQDSSAASTMTPPAESQNTAPSMPEGGMATPTPAPSVDGSGSSDSSSHN